MCSEVAVWRSAIAAMRSRAVLRVEDTSPYIPLSSLRGTEIMTTSLYLHLVHVCTYVCGEWGLL